MTHFLLGRISMSNLLREIHFVGCIASPSKLFIHLLIIIKVKRYFEDILESQHRLVTRSAGENKDDNTRLRTDYYQSPVVSFIHFLPLCS